LNFPKQKWLLGISPEHEHKKILETGEAVREKCIQCCYWAYFSKSKLQSKTDLPDDQEAQKKKDEEPVTKTTDNELDPNSNLPEPEPSDTTNNLNEISELQSETGGTKTNPDKDKETVNNFLKTDKNWKNLPLETS